MENKDLINKAKKLINSSETTIQNDPLKSTFNYFIRKKLRKVSVIIPTFNSATFIKKCINSVIKQSFRFKDIELIIIDDHSTDNTPEILLDYSKKYKNITVVLLNENTGTPATPRNIGIELSTTEKLLFLDSDDWLDKEAIKELVNAMDNNQSDIVFGKTIKVTDTSERNYVEYMSYKNYSYNSIFDFPILFYYMGPLAKLIKSSIVKNNNIMFKEMKFNEDKFFLLDLYIVSGRVSTITNSIYYVNRLSQNNKSLMKSTNELYKRSKDILIIKEILSKNLHPKHEKLLLKRFIESDLIKSCLNKDFINSKHQSEFIGFVRKALKLINDKPYNLIELFESPIYSIAAKLIKENRDDELIKFASWNILDKNKKIVIEDKCAFYEVPIFNTNNSYNLIPIKFLAISIDAYVEDNFFVQKFRIYGELRNTAKYIIIRDRNNYRNELIIPISIEGNNCVFTVSYNELNKLESSSFTILIRYNQYQLANIRRLSRNIVNYKTREFNFYSTKSNNLGFSIKNK